MTKLPELTNAMPEMVAIRRDLHAIRTGLEEVRTSGIVAERLEALGYRVTRNLAGTGIVGTLSNGDGPAIGIRADMDALPILEETGLDYASTIPARCMPAAMTGTRPFCLVRRG